MNDINKELLLKFDQIKNKWYECNIKGSGAAGRMLENLLGLYENSLPIPDFDNIELKTHYGLKNDFVSLFNCVPEIFNDTTRLRTLYGYPCKSFPQYNMLMVSVFHGHKTRVGIKYYFELHIDNINKRLVLYIYDIHLNLIDTNTYWDFDTLQFKLDSKMQTLAYIKTYRKYYQNKVYFKYHSLTLYQLKSFDDFIYAIKMQYIRVNFKITIYTNGDKIGQTYSHGISFDLNKKHFDAFYDKIYYRD